MINLENYKITIENPKGSYKSFVDVDDPTWSTYPLKGVTYPVDYGFIADYQGEDGADLDVFIGTGNKNGYIKVWRLDVPEETKFFINLTEKELEDVIVAFKPVILKTEILNDDDFVSVIEKFKVS